MDSDLMLVAGLLVGLLSIPSLLGAFADGRVPRVAAIAVVVAGGLIALAVSEQPGGYDLNDIPNIFLNVVARYIS